MISYGRYADESFEERDARVAVEEAADRATYAAVTDRRVLAVLDVLAPVRYDTGGDRSPVFEFGHETTPTPAEMIVMATEIIAAIDAVESHTASNRSV